MRSKTMLDSSEHVTASYDAVIVGAGFSGLYILHRLRRLGLTARIFEAGSAVGGTWFWNRYPGARVDIESVEYSYSFSPELEDEWQWSERYAPQAELLAYINHVADRFDLRRDVQLETRVVLETYDEAAKRWKITTDSGGVVSARYCIMATGCLSVPKDIDILGAERFQRETYRTSRWPHEGVDFTGKRVAVIGTGSSAVQAIPKIAKQASQLYVFQRTPNFSLPAHNGPLDAVRLDEWRVNRNEYRAKARGMGFGQVQIDECDKKAEEFTPEEQRSILEDRWERGGFCLGGAFGDLISNKAANEVVSEFVREKIRSIVADPNTAEMLAPTNHPIFTKRPCVDTEYFETYNRDNVTLIDLNKTPVATVTETGIRTSDEDYEFDAIVYAIGFDAMTGALERIDIRGLGGRSLKEKWADGPRTYLGLMVSGFPNMFLVTGPGSPSVLSNMLVSIEQHVDWITKCIADLGSRELGVIEATPEAEQAWVDHVNEVGNATLYPLANSWYMGANVPGKPRVFMPYIGGVNAYRTRCDEVAANGYEGCVLS